MSNEKLYTRYYNRRNFQIFVLKEILNVIFVLYDKGENRKIDELTTNMTSKEVKVNQFKKAFYKNS